MKEYQITIKGQQYTITQDEDGKFIVPDFIKEYEKYGTALKPAYEPIIVARKPLDGSCVDNVIKWGVGGLNIDGCRVPFDGDKWNKTTSGKTSRAYQSEKMTTANGVCEANELGRYPANLILTYDEEDKEEVCGGMPESKSVGGKTTIPKMNSQSDGINIYNFGKHNAERLSTDYMSPCDEGSAARYFYCAKASNRDRDEGLDGFNLATTGELQGGRKEGSAGSIMQCADGSTRVNPYAGTGTPKKNTHPTVKPCDLMQYLVRLVTPKGGTVLDPFMGSGSTGKACMYENRDRNSDYKFIGIEMTEEYLPIARARIEYAANDKANVVEEIVVENNEVKKVKLEQMRFDLWGVE